MNSHHTAQVAFDAGTVYELDSFPSGVRAATIKNVDIPDDDGTCANYFWLAYASACYFEHATNNKLKPIWMLDDPYLVDEQFTVKAKWSNSPQAPHLPKQIVYFSDGIYRHLTDGKRGSYSASAPFNQGYTNALYETLSVTNLSGLEIPSEFKFTRFYISGKELRPRMIVTAKVAEFRTNILPPNFRPRFSGSVDVSDHRLLFPGYPTRPTPRPFSYKAKDGVWPNLKELQPTYEKELKKRQEHQKKLEKPGFS
ncbi:MAG: hypothetical protein ABIR24_05595 [Verrucomicrobiota bacterium]